MVKNVAVVTDTTACIPQDKVAEYGIELFITEFTPVMGVHTGPGVIGAAFYCEE